MDLIAAIVEDALDEALGTSRGKWALVVVAALAGVAGGVWLSRRVRPAAPAPLVPAELDAA